MGQASVVERLTSLRQHQVDGHRSPHKPLLVLLALGQLSTTGSSTLDWSAVEFRLGALLAEFGSPTSTGASAAAYPFTRLRADGVWQLSRDVPNDNVGLLREAPITGEFPPDVEKHLLASEGDLVSVAGQLVESQFPFTVAPDVLAACGLDPDAVLGASPALAPATARKRDPVWRRQIVEAWDRSCAFCGFDGSAGGAPVGIEAAHIRWFNFGGPDALDNGLALCSLHHKLLDRGVLGFRDPETVTVSSTYSASSEQGRRVYDLHEHKLRARPGTRMPAQEHVDWHRQEVFKGAPLR